MHGPYTGLKVVELGRFIAAPYCGQLLADGGADVIKVEPLVGDDARRNGTRFSPTEARQYLNKNRGKRSIALQLSDPRIRRVVQGLLREADVTIVNFRPGQGEKLGLDYDTVSRTNPRIVYAQNTAFGPRGPLAGRAGMDILLQAYTGMAPLTDAGPRPLEDPFVDYTAALLMAWGIATALYNRERTGKGQKLDVSLLQAALVIQNNSIHHIDAVDGWRKGFVEHLKTAFAQGRTMSDVLERRETLKPSISPPYYGFFETKDGYIVIGAGGRGLQVRVAKLLGIEDPALGDPNFKIDDIAAYTRRMRRRSASRLAEETTASWLEKFNAAGLPVGEYRLKDEIFDDPHVWENGYLARLDHEEVGGMTVVAPPVKFSKTPMSTTTASPTLGKHSREILTEAGLSEAAINRLLADGVVRGSAEDLSH